MLWHKTSCEQKENKASVCEAKFQLSYRANKRLGLFATAKLNLYFHRPPIKRILHLPGNLCIIFSLCYAQKYRTGSILLLPYRTKFMR